MVTVAACLLLALLNAHASPAHAQSTPADTSADANPDDANPDDALDEDALDKSGELGPGLRTLPGTEGGEVVVTLEQFGVGGFARTGDWVAVQLKILDKGSAARDVLVRLAVPDSDGDTAQQQRQLATNPGSGVTVWMYVRLPFRDAPIDVRVYAAGEPGSDNLPSELRATAGEVLGGLRIFPNDLPGRGQASTENVGAIAVLGNQPLGLQEYGKQYVNTSVAEFGNELTRVAVGVRVGDLPDRWMGLSQFETIVWGSGDPLELQRSAARADALRQWVMRGGHLVVVLPSVGQTWTDASNPLASIMPDVTVERRENAPMLPFRPLLTTPLERSDPFPSGATVHVLTPNASAAEGHAVPILEGPNGECVVVRRVVGLGAVTVVGLDLNHPGIRQRVFADVFWHRVLGRKGDLNPASGRATQMNAMTMAAFGTSASWMIDKGIPALTNVLGKSALGAAAAFFLFAIYWLFVGPPMFWLLRKQGKHHQSWITFMLGVAAFSLLAWIAATSLRPRNSDATVFAVIDHVYASEIADGVPQQRTRMWGSVLVPRYGTARLSVGSPGGDALDSLSSLAAFDAPEAEGGFGGFPDTRGYPIDTLTPDAASMPVRATVKSIVAEWAGSPVWAMPLPTARDGSPDRDARVRLEKLSELRRRQGEGAAVPAGEATGSSASGGTDGASTASKPPTGSSTARTMPGSQELMPSGTLVHKLPGALTNMTIIVVRGQSTVRGSPNDFDPIGVAMRLESGFAWGPDEPLSLDAISVQAGQRALPGIGSMLSQLANNPTDGSDQASLSQQMLALSFLQLLPAVDRNNRGGPTRPAQRRITHGLDLSRWASQPCLIIMGTVELDGGRNSPMPLYLDGESIPMRGRVLVRWVYPLSPQPPAFAANLQQEPRPAEREKTDKDAEQGDDTGLPGGDGLRR
jgi:hypothetical protein